MSNVRAEFEGSEEGIAVWSKLISSEDNEALTYARRLSDVAMKHYSVYFTDVIAQKQKPLNNQKVFYMCYSTVSGKWNVSLFHTPSAQ